MPEKIYKKVRRETPLFWIIQEIRQGAFFAHSVNGG